MPDHREAIISIHGVHSQRILAGSKTVEPRRRFPQMPAGSRLWIYETMPIGAVVGFVTVTNMEAGTAEALWECHSKSIGVAREEFMAYLDGCAKASAISLADAHAIAPIALSTLRSIRPRFQAPQVMTLLSQPKDSRCSGWLGWTGGLQRDPRRRAATRRSSSCPSWRKGNNYRARSIPLGSAASNSSCASLAAASTHGPSAHVPSGATHPAASRHLARSLATSSGETTAFESSNSKRKPKPCRTLTIEIVD